MKHAVNAEYGDARAGRLIDRLLLAQRRRLIDAFAEFRQGNPDDTVLQVGMLPTPLFDNPDHLVEWSDHQARSRILSYQIEQPGAIRHPTGSAEAGAIHLPFRDGSFDWVFCAEIIERVGGIERQHELLGELNRVARKGVFVTAGNRRHPIEFNTGLPFIHRLPDMAWRALLKWAGKGAWADPSALQLLDADTLSRLAERLPGQPKNAVGHKRVFAIKAHFFLMIWKDAAKA